MAFYRVRITKLDESFAFVDTNNDSLYAVMDDVFTFTVPGYRWSKAYKAGRWDGKIRVFDQRTQRLPLGLMPELLNILRRADYGEVELVGFNKRAERVNVLEALDAFDLRMDPHEHQLKALDIVVNKKRAVILSPTSSGKSYVIDLATRILSDRRILVVVPSTTLVDQMVADLKGYGNREPIARIMGGMEKYNSERIVVSTWQSIPDMPDSWYEQFDVVFVDECHTAVAKVVTSIVERCTNARYKVGFTGTLRDSKIDVMQLRGLFGEVHEMVTTADLMEAGIVANTKIEMVRVDYGKLTAKEAEVVHCLEDYESEIKFVLSVEERDDAIFAKLDERSAKNGIVLAKRVKHVRRLFEKYRTAHPERGCFLIDGGRVEGGGSRIEVKERVDSSVGERRGVVLFATYGTLSTGVSIRNLDYGIFAHPVRSRVTVLQSLGRLLRISDSKDSAELLDMWDDIPVNGDRRISFGLRHAEARLGYYKDAGIPVTETSVRLAPRAERR